MIETIIPVSADTEDQAAFQSIDAALRFAFANQYRQDAGTLARFQKRTHRSPGIFDDKLEAAAWAGDIRRRIGTIHPSGLAILVVYYAPRSFPCACRNACCSGWKVNQEWRDAMGVVVQASTQAVAGTISNRQLRDGIVRKWAGADKVNLGVLAEKCGVHRNTVGQQAKSIRKWLDQLLFAAQTEADLCLRGVKV